MADPDVAARAAAWAVAQAGAASWNELCQQFVENAYATTGQYGTAREAISGLKPRRSLNDAKVGDVVLFRGDSTNGYAGHAGIYLGNGKMVSATSKGVKEDNILTDPYYVNLFVGVAEAPVEWKGRASTPELEAGAQRLIAAAKGPVVDPYTQTHENRGPLPPTKEPPRVTTLERLNNHLETIDTALKKWDNPSPELQFKAPEEIAKLISQRTSVLAQIGAEENRIRDDAKAPRPLSPKSVTQNFGSTARPDWRQYNQETGEWEAMANAPTADPMAAQTEQVNLATAQARLATAQRELEKSTSPEAQRLAQIEVEKAQLDLDKAKRDPITTVTGKTGVVTGLNQQTGDQAWQFDPRSPEQQQLDLLTSSIALGKAQQTQAALDAALAFPPGSIERRQALQAVTMEAARYSDPQVILREAELEATKQRDAENVRTNTATAVRGLMGLENSRSADAAQARNQHMKSGLGSLRDQPEFQRMTQPIDPQMAAQAVGMDPNSAKFQAIWSAWNQSTMGGGGQQMGQPPAPVAAPVPQPTQASQPPGQTAAIFGGQPQPQAFDLAATGNPGWGQALTVQNGMATPDGSPYDIPEEGMQAAPAGPPPSDIASVIEQLGFKRKQLQTA